MLYIKTKIAIISLVLIVISYTSTLGGNITSKSSYFIDIPYNYKVSNIVLEDIKWKVAIPDSKKIFDSVLEGLTTDDFYQRLEYIDYIDKNDATNLPIYKHISQIISLIKDKQYDEADELLKTKPDYLFFYPQLNDLKIIIYYATGRYDNVVNYYKYASKLSSFLYLDSIPSISYDLQHGNLERYLSLDQIYYLKSKILLHEKRYDEFLLEINKIEEDIYKFLLLKEYSKVDMAGSYHILYGIKLQDDLYKDYPTYIDAIRNLKMNNYRLSFNLLNGINSQDIDHNLEYYKGMAIANSDLERSEPYLISSLINEVDATKIADIKFMLAQYYLMKNSFDDALQLIDGCHTENCDMLRSVIYLKNNDYASFLEIYDKLRIDEIYLLKAIIHFNNGEYDSVLDEVQNIKVYNDEINRLIMLTYFKLDKLSEAIEIIEKNINNDTIFIDGLKELYIFERYKEIEKKLQDRSYVPEEVLFLKAKIALLNKNIQKAKDIYNNLIINNISLYESFSELESLEKSRNSKLKFIYKAMDKIEEIKAFDNKDKLLYNFSEIALKNNDNVLLVRILNDFFSSYNNSDYMGRMYATRGLLFFNTARYQECLTNMYKAIELEPEIEKNIRFKIAECSEGVDSEDTLTLYKNIADDTTDPLRAEAALKVISLSQDMQEVLKYTLAIKNDNVKGYIKGIRIYIEQADVVDLEANIDFINHLTKSDKSELKAAGYFAMARIQMQQKNEKKATEYYNKLIKNFPKDYFSQKSKNGKSMKEILNIE